MTVMQRLVPWIVGGIVLSIALAAVYLTAQQLDRGGADDEPQRLATQLASLGDIPSPSPADRVELASSQAVFYVVYDATGKPVSGTGYLDGALAQVPKGVITTAAADGSNAVTWQPERGLRFATVELRAGDVVIVSGQSLGPSETRTDHIGALLLIGWLVAIALLAGGGVLTVRVG
jgi:hypothetical protein